MVSRRARDYYKFLQSVESFTNGQVKVSDWDSDFMSWVSLDVTPNEGPYKDAKIAFRIDLPRQFPKHSPSVQCFTNIYHPNIDPTGGEGNVCLSLLDEWETSFGMEDCVQGLLFLLYEPNELDPLSPYFDGTSMENFYRSVRLSLTGRHIEDFVGQRLIEDDEEVLALVKELEEEKEAELRAEEAEQAAAEEAARIAAEEAVKEIAEENIKEQEASTTATPEASSESQVSTQSQNCVEEFTTLKPANPSNSEESRPVTTITDDANTSDSNGDEVKETTCESTSSPSEAGQNLSNLAEANCSNMCSGSAIDIREGNKDIILNTKISGAVEINDCVLQTSSNTEDCQTEVPAQIPGYISLSCSDTTENIASDVSPMENENDSISTSQVQNNNYTVQNPEIKDGDNSSHTGTPTTGASVQGDAAVLIVPEVAPESSVCECIEPSATTQAVFGHDKSEQTANTEVTEAGSPADDWSLMAYGAIDLPEAADPSSDGNNETTLQTETSMVAALSSETNFQIDKPSIPDDATPNTSMKDKSEVQATTPEANNRPSASESPTNATIDDKPEVQARTGEPNNISSPSEGSTTAIIEDKSEVQTTTPEPNNAPSTSDGLTPDTTTEDNPEVQATSPELDNENNTGSAPTNSTETLADKTDMESMLKRVQELMMKPNDFDRDYGSEDEYDGHEDESVYEEEDEPEIEEENAETDETAVQTDIQGEQQLNLLNRLVGAEGFCAQGLTRQSSKVERIEAGFPFRTFHDKGTQTGDNFKGNLGSYLNAVKTCSFVAPDYDSALLYVGATCLYAFHRFLK